MGKTSIFFKTLFGFKPPEPTQPPPSDVDKQPKRRWSFFRSHKVKPHHHHLSNTYKTSLSRPRDTTRHDHYSNHVTCTGDGSTNNHGVDYVWAAVKIQSYFRSYLARKALKALKALVKLQALVRGNIQRKQAADDMRRLQALVRVQARTLASRFQIADSPHSTTKGPPTPEKFEHIARSRITKNNPPSILKNNGWKPYEERNEKILEIDATKPHIRLRNLFQPDHISYCHRQSLTTSRRSTIQPPGLSPSGSYEVNSQTSPLKYSTHDLEEEVSPYTTQNSPLLYTKRNGGSMRVSPFTPAKSDSSRSCLSGYSDHPNYMAYTESSRAKVRSLSAPRQSSNFDSPSTSKRYSMYGYGLAAQHGGSNMRDSFVSKAYPGSGRLDLLGMPVGCVGFSGSDFSGGYWN